MTAPLRSIVNGRENGCIAISDRGFQYGDGVFETLAVWRGEPLAWESHLERLSMGCARLAIPMPAAALLHQESASLCGGIERAVLKITLTRGEAGRGYRHEAGAPTRVISVWPWPQYPKSHREQGVRVRLCETRISNQPRLAGIKHLNRLEQVLARAEWGDEFAEGLMLDAQGVVVGGTMTNLFVVVGDTLVTPELAQSGIAGVTRRLVMECARELGWACREEGIAPEALLQADELFLTNSIIGVWPIAEYQQRRFTVGDKTRAIQKILIEDRSIAPD